MGWDGIALSGERRAGQGKARQVRQYRAAQLNSIQNSVMPCSAV
jgi:hypothetical protein